MYLGTQVWAEPTETRIADLIVSFYLIYNYCYLNATSSVFRWYCDSQKASARRFDSATADLYEHFRHCSTCISPKWQWPTCEAALPDCCAHRVRYTRYWIIRSLINNYNVRICQPGMLELAEANHLHKY